MTEARDILARKLASSMGNHGITDGTLHSGYLLADDLMDSDLFEVSETPQDADAWRKAAKSWHEVSDKQAALARRLQKKLNKITDEIRVAKKMGTETFSTDYLENLLED